MPKMQVAVELGMGTDLRGEDYTKAARKAVRDAVSRNFLNMAAVLGFPREAMIVDVRVGVQKPAEVRVAEVAQEIPYGTVTVESVHGGADLDMEGVTVVVANAIVAVSFDVDKETAQ